MDNLGSLKIDQLTENNCHVWRQKVELLLSCKELGDHIIESHTLPEDPEDVSKWDREDAKAMTIIWLTISDEYLQMISEFKSAISMWMSIKDVFQKATLLNRLRARQKFYSVETNDGERVLSYIARVQQLSSDLKSMDVELSEQDVSMTLLSGLPSRFEHLIVAIDTLSDEDALRLDFVKSRLMREEQRMSDHDISLPSSSDFALVHYPKNSNRSNKFFNYCRKTNYTEAYCWKKQNDENRKDKGLVSKSGNETSPGKNNDDAYCLMARNKPEIRDDLKCVIDSGATSHMTYNQQ